MAASAYHYITTTGAADFRSSEWSSAEQEVTGFAFAFTASASGLSFYRLPSRRLFSFHRPLPPRRAHW